jgi:hypothetical protein
VPDEPLVQPGVVLVRPPVVSTLSWTSRSATRALSKYHSANRALAHHFRPRYRWDQGNLGFTRRCGRRLRTCLLSNGSPSGLGKNACDPRPSTSLACSHSNWSRRARRLVQHSHSGSMSGRRLLSLFFGLAHYDCVVRGLEVINPQRERLVGESRPYPISSTRRYFTIACS